MIDLINDLPADVVGIELTGEVTKAEYDTVFPKIEKLAEREGEINYLVVLKTDFKNLTIGVWWDDFKLALQHVTKWNRVAIVSDEAFVRRAIDVLGFAYPGESKAFELSEVEAAIQWVSGNS